MGKERGDINDLLHPVSEDCIISRRANDKIIVPAALHWLCLQYQAAIVLLRLLYL